MLHEFSDNESSRRGRERMVVGFTINCEISAYQH